MALRAIKNLLRKDVAIDLGTANTLVYLDGQGIVLREPTVIATDLDNSLVALGEEAKAYLGKAPSHIQVKRPLKAGVIEDFDSVAQFIKEVVEISKKGRSFLSSRVVICIPSKLTQVEKKAVLVACKEAGFKKVFLLEEAFAAAIGANLDISQKRPMMVVDIGGGTTEVAVISQRAYIISDSRKIGGDDMDEALCSQVLKTHSLKIGPVTAERLKWDLGSLTPEAMHKLGKKKIAGIDIKIQRPAKVDIDPSFVNEVIGKIAREIVLLIREIIDELDEAIKNVIINDGLILTGGVSLLRGSKEYFSKNLGISVKVTSNPLDTVVLGAGKVLSNFRFYKDIFAN